MPIAIVAPRMAISVIPHLASTLFFLLITKEDVAPGILRFTIVSVPVDRDPIVTIPVLIRSVAIAHMVPVMHMFVKGLGNPERDRQHHTEQTVQYPRDKVGVMNVVV